MKKISIMLLTVLFFSLISFNFAGAQESPYERIKVFIDQCENGDFQNEVCVYDENDSLVTEWNEPGWVEVITAMAPPEYKEVIFGNNLSEWTIAHQEYDEEFVSNFHISEDGGVIEQKWSVLVSMDNQALFRWKIYLKYFVFWFHNDSFDSFVLENMAWPVYTPTCFDVPNYIYFAFHCNNKLIFAWNVRNDTYVDVNSDEWDELSRKENSLTCYRVCSEAPD